MAEFDSDNLRLTDFLDLATLQEIQDSFAAVANVKATITDAEGQLVTQPTPTKEFLRRQKALAAEEEALAVEAQPAAEGPQREGGEYVAPIIVNNQRLGTIRMTANTALAGIDEAKLTSLATKLGLEPKQLRTLATQLMRARQSRPAAIQFLFLLANAIARLCFQEFQLRQRINELTAVYNVTMMLAEARDVNRVLQRTTEVVCDVMGCKASSIRLIDVERDELVIRAVHNLSKEYLAKGAIRFSKAEIDRVALSPRGYEYVKDMRTDPRVQFPTESAREGHVSMVSAGMRYKGKPIGVLRVYTAEERVFTQLEIDLLKAVAAQAAAAIENARLLAETLEAEALEQQVQMAATVQQRMIPQTPPKIPGLDLSACYVPCYTLGGDFYDIIELPDNNVGLVVADVSGKGVPASLIMASVRAALRAHVDNVYYLYEVIRRVNQMLYRDTRTEEFVTLFYGVFDGRNRRLTYCNAGHPPGLLLRNDTIIELGSDNMVLGVNPDEPYAQSIIDLKPDDTLLLYTDGLLDGVNFEGKRFGRQRLVDSFKSADRSGGAATVADQVLWDLRKFVGMTKPADDVTMIAARVG
ncbi:MAG: SpoIIE family protein phosphatase [Phycisphaerae bacterium]|nr:SpoIIE family protein phosphatase [Tepidisphaeraceae bacterium]